VLVVIAMEQPPVSGQLCGDRRLCRTDRGDPVTGAGDVRAMMTLVAGADPEQTEDWWELVSPLELAHVRLVVRTVVEGGIWIAYSDVFKLVLVEFPASRLAVLQFCRGHHVDLPPSSTLSIKVTFAGTKYKDWDTSPVAAIASAWTDENSSARARIAGRSAHHAAV
jgi:hypothetical protein